MSTRVATLLAWSLFGLFVVSVAATLWLVATGTGTSDDTWVVLAIGYAVAGALVATREPRNAVGWLLLVTAVSYGTSSLAYAYVRNAGHPGGVASAWYADWGWVVWVYTAAMLLPMLFPNGRPLSRRWSAAVAVAAVAIVLSIVGEALAAGDLDVEGPQPIENPLAIGGPLADVVTAVGLVGAALAMIGLTLGGVSFVLRLRRSRGRERQQLKVFAFVLVMFLVCALLFVVALVLVATVDAGWTDGLLNFGWITCTLLLTLGLPFAVGVAILRHHLYGIDVVINRTLVYGALTATLAASYLGSVLVLRLVLSPLTGESDLAIAGSTLAVAALFRPARRRIQALVDRRFYRRRYDAARTLEAFSGRLRSELDLEALGADLRHVVADTVQPTHVSVWLRESPH